MNKFNCTHACSVMFGKTFMKGKGGGGKGACVKREKENCLHNLQCWYTLLPFGFANGFDKQQRARVPGGQTKLLPKRRREIISRMLVGKWTSTKF